jgi:hypothetical protein
MSSVTVSTSRTWLYFAGWMLVGTSCVMVIAGAFTIGIFFVPITALGAILMSRRRSARVGLPGLVAGLGLPFFFVAYLNRGGPGNVCAKTLTVFGPGESCSQEWNPWIILAGGLFFVTVGVTGFTLLRRRRATLVCSNCGAVLEPSFNFCPACRKSINETIRP